MEKVQSDLYDLGVRQDQETIKKFMDEWREACADRHQGCAECPLNVADEYDACDLVYVQSLEAVKMRDKIFDKKGD